MRFQEKMREYSKEELWREYCGFLDLSLPEYMTIQRRLLLEQVELWSSCVLGQTFLKGRCPHTVEEFREMVPLTTYDDYAATLLSKQASDLPAERDARPLLGDIPDRKWYAEQIAVAANETNLNELKKMLKEALADGKNV